MSIQLVCQHCGATPKVHQRLAGRTVHCPSCDQELMVPELQIDQAESDGDSLDATEVVEVEAIPQAATSQPVVAEAVAVEPVAAQPVVAAAIIAPTPESLSADAPGDWADHDDDDEPPTRKKREDEELDMTPMVDVTFLLLIFFMVTASFSLQKSIAMPRQTSELPSLNTEENEEDEKDPIELEIDEFGAFFVTAAEFEQETPGKQNLVNALKRAVGDRPENARLDIKVHEDAKLQALVDGMDAGTIAGLTEIQVTQVDQFN
ncbi:MAG: biopolymer transporter ExbD [Planctomycetota bacterium]